MSINLGDKEYSLAQFVQWNHFYSNIVNGSTYIIVIVVSHYSSSLLVYLTHFIVEDIAF
jgi:hypothetical protein